MPAESEKSIKIIKQLEIMERRLGFVEKYMLLAQQAVASQGKGGYLATCEFGFPSFFGDSSISTIEAINNGNLNALGLMAVEFDLLATVSDRRDLIEQSPLIVTKDKMEIRQASN